MAAVQPQTPTVYLHPGQLYVSDADETITAVLGSCVSICLWDPVRGAGGMNHYLLPHTPPGPQASARFGNVAFAQLLRQMQILGCQPAALRAILVGGACVIGSFRGPWHLGEKNVVMARRLVADAGIPIFDEHVGGTAARRLRFHVQHGTTAIRSLGGV